MAIRLAGTAIDLSVWKPPTRNRLDRHGEDAIEKMPTQRSRYMLNPAGHGVYVALHSGSGNRSPNDPMALRILDEKMRKGFLPFDRCPQTLEMTKFIPAEVKGRPVCKVGADGQRPISQENPCPCLKEIEAIRTKTNDKKMAEAEARYKSKDQRDRDQRDRQIDALERNLEKGKKS
jgi:hypothetical protein